jgi:hypothetical protein
VAYRQQTQSQSPAKISRPCHNQGELPRLVRMNPPPESDSPPEFDVFLCYNRKDSAEIRSIAQDLRDRHISYWLDVEQLPPGTYWLDTQERDMARLKTVAIFIGQHGIGRWQRLEISIFLQQFVEQNLKIIPVFLRDAPADTQLQLFLKLFTWIDFRLANPDPIAALVQGITQPQPNPDPSLVAQTRQVIADETQINIPNNLTRQGAIAPKRL